MGRPKEALTYHGIEEPKRMYKLLQELTVDAYYSLRPDQKDQPIFEGANRIIDSVPEGGPLAALANAYSQLPGISWLVVPVDMPFLEVADLKILIDSRDMNRGIIAYSDGMGSFQPLPAIYECTLADTAQQMLAEGRRAIRGLGDWIDPVCLHPAELSHLMNVNTAREKDRAMEVIHG